MRAWAVILCLGLLIGPAMAGELEKGDHEVTLRLSYTDTDFGTSGGIDFGSSKDTEIALTYGWLVTERHEFGFLAGYVRQELKGGDLFADSSTDGTQIGGFYAYNFDLEGMATPYIGVSVATLGGDLGDAYDLEYTAELGVKIYPFEHGGVSAGLGFFKMQADAPGLADADGFHFGVGLLIKY